MLLFGGNNFFFWKEQSATARIVVVTAEWYIQFYEYWSGKGGKKVFFSVLTVIPPILGSFFLLCQLLATTPLFTTCSYLPKMMPSTDFGTVVYV